MHLTSTCMSRSSSNASASTETTPPPPDTDPLEGLEGEPIHQYTGIRKLKDRVNSQSIALMKGRTNRQFLIFRGITKDDLAEIDSKRVSIGRQIRISHYADDNLLIIKLMPLTKHERAHLTLFLKIRDQLVAMGLSDETLAPAGATRLTSRTRSSKEGDSGYLPPSREHETDWPTIVLESELSEWLPRLRHDAKMVASQLWR